MDHGCILVTSNSWQEGMLPSSCEDGSSVAIIEVHPGIVRPTLELSAHDAGAEPPANDPAAARSMLEPPTIVAGAGRTSLEPSDLGDV
jgi:hypothetical protein